MTSPGKTQGSVYYRKQIPLLRLIEKMKLWPSRRGILHGIQEIEIRGGQAFLTTHCGRRFGARNSKNSRSARWLRNKWFHVACPECAIPEWKMKKYSETIFKRRWGSLLREEDASPEKA